jgi:glyoxylase-like metal-dependent hydrolase (beta-lactamase superfamily II)
LGSPRLPPFVEALSHGIHAIDTGFQRERFDAAYLIVQEGRGAFVDTGTNFALPRLLAALEALGLARDDVDYVIPTHVHLDHAGGAGALMRELPRAKLVVHPRGARHLIDPAALYASALAVYGQPEMDRSYGQPVGVDAARVITTHDAMVLDWSGRRLIFLDTPGHAKHHHCLWDEASRGWFTGDTFGIAYPEFVTAAGPWIFPTSTPVQFDPEPLIASVQRLTSYEPQCMYLTHFGRVQGVPRLAALQTGLIRRMADLGRRLQAAPDRHEALKQGLLGLYLGSLSACGSSMPPADAERLLAVDLELNAQGIAVWLDRETA